MSYIHAVSVVQDGNLANATHLAILTDRKLDLLAASSTIRANVFRLQARLPGSVR